MPNTLRCCQTSSRSPTRAQTAPPSPTGTGHRSDVASLLLEAVRVGKHIVIHGGIIFNPDPITPPGPHSLCFTAFQHEELADLDGRRLKAQLLLPGLKL